MLLLISIIIFGIFFAFFATQNSQTVSIILGGYSFSEVPLYLIALLPLALGLLLAYLIYTAKNLSSSVIIKELKKDLELKSEELVQVTKKAHKLEIENTKLKAELGEPEDSHAL